MYKRSFLILGAWVMFGVAGCSPAGMGAGDGGDDSSGSPVTDGSNANANMDGGAGSGGGGSSDSGVVPASFRGWMRTALLEAFDPVGDDLYGDAVATSGDTIIVGTQYKELLDGRADVFIRFGGEWRFHARLVPGESRTMAQGFGSAVAVSTRQALVGAYKYDIPGSFGIQRGAVYVFENSGPGWDQRQLVTIPDGEDFEQFGSSLSMDAGLGRFASGAPGRDGSTGAVYVFATGGAAFTQEQRLEPADGLGFDYFGEALALAGSRLAVGAPGQDFGTGAVYVYEHDGVAWRQVQKLMAPNPSRSDRYGDAVAMESDVLVVAASSKKRPGDELLQAGVVYIYRLSGDQFLLEQEIVPDDGLAGNFGSSLGIDGGRIAVGIDSKSLVLLLERTGDTWTEEVAELTPQNEFFVLDSFGASLAFSESTLVVGSRSANAGGQRAAGAAYVFEQPASGPDLPDGVRARGR